MTKKEMFAEIRACVADNAEMVAFIDHEIELLNRKSNSPKKPTKTQVENEGFKDDILEALAEAGEPVSISQLIAYCESINGLSNQRITHLLTALRKENKVARTYVKKVAYFSIGAEDEGE